MRTQTAFVPGRDIADNVLLHLEEMDYLQEAAWAAGVHYVSWTLRRRTTASTGSGCSAAWRPCSSLTAACAGCACCWRGPCGQVVFNGGHNSRVFDIPSGCAQGSPLSPLLYVIAAQPLAAKCRQLQREGSVDSISLPGEQAAPCSHQHADDTTLHAQHSGRRAHAAAAGQ